MHMIEFDRAYDILRRGLHRLAIIVIPIPDNIRCVYGSQECVFIGRKIFMDYEKLLKLIDFAIENNIVTCIVYTCKTGYKHRNVEVVELCSNSHNEISKHRYDSFLKCISFSDTIAVISKKNEIPLPISMIIALAQAMQKDVINIVIG